MNNVSFPSSWGVSILQNAINETKQFQQKIIRNVLNCCCQPTFVTNFLDFKRAPAHFNSARVKSVAVCAASGSGKKLLPEKRQNGSLWGGEFGAKIFLKHWCLQCFPATKALKPLFWTKNHSTKMPQIENTLACRMINAFLILLSFHNSLQCLEMYRYTTYFIHTLPNAYEKGSCDSTAIEDSMSLRR